MFLVLKCASLSETLRPVCLPHWASEPFNNDHGIITGWGKDGYYNRYDSSNMKEADVVIWNNNFCRGIMNLTWHDNSWHTVTK